MDSEKTKTTVIISANGEGSRMKGISPIPKHLLYLGGRRVIDRISGQFHNFEVKVLTHYDTPGHEVIKCKPTKTRDETLENIRALKDVLICDCDILPIGWMNALHYNSVGHFDFDIIWCFKSQNPKYGGIYIDAAGDVVRVCEKGDTETKLRASGLYFLKDVGATIDRMTDPNSIASGMIGARVALEDKFIRFGDPEDYFKAIKEFAV